MKLEKILYATDLSPGADDAGRRALQLARDHGANLRVINVVNAPVVNDEIMRRLRGSPGDMMADLAEATEMAMRDRMQALGASDEDDIDYHCIQGQGHKQILAEARTYGADLMVVGSHGERTLQDVLLGTTTQNLVHHTDRPILVVKRPVDGPYERVVVPVDFSKRTRSALELGASLAPGQKIHAVHAHNLDALDNVLRNRVDRGEVDRIKSEVSAERQQELDAFLVSCDVSPEQVESHLRMGYAPDVLDRAVLEWQAQLVVMGTHGRNRLQDALLGGVARRVVHQVKDADVLLVRA
ncbi:MULTISPECIES: universal stress protein [unclassified Ectothiorhodospira]|jgi:nucleotide-binding universal stress UspA family protein|uniref:universal stress protein n=1 Tax=unclassified Ectothiorhodospira TaxID=2684909 RepID=UPI001EE8B79B|nr:MULTISPECIES: universal stress protein [unclassified Ectothiorhodospira]MCG5516275.1 universal stress protein [Ectothiorhodospira sp. 9100]MCG5518052.1 universal stress protein [Ectothiorhodospira sp. 9905]